MFNAVKYLFWLLSQIIVGAWVIVVDSFRPVSRMHPVVVSYPLRVTSERDLAVFSTSITITPGTISVGFREPEEPGGPRRLLVQAVYGADPAEVLSGLADMEERMNPSVKDIDHGAPGQGTGNPLRSTFVAGHSDSDFGFTETDHHYKREEQ